MDENLVGYLLDCLDEAGNRQVEAYLLLHPEARQKLARLKQAISPLAVDRDEIAPPPGLAARTVARIGEQVGGELPRAPREPVAAMPIGRSWWRRADVLVTASLLVFVLGIASPLAYRWRERQATVACQDNLRQFHAALTTYRDQQGAYPDVTREGPRGVAGVVVPMLSDAGVLPQTFTVRCPAVGAHLGCTITLASLRKMSDEEFQAQAPTFALCYAFNLGYHDAAGVYHTPWQLPGAITPVLADSAPVDGSISNSSNHGGGGQNVLFLDGHCRFVTQRIIGDPPDDIFLNRINRVASGLGEHDTVLGNSPSRP
jgi:prepilin-type processing-associated H-X9-DG protein